MLWLWVHLVCPWHLPFRIAIVSGVSKPILLQFCHAQKPAPRLATWPSAAAASSINNHIVLASPLGLPCSWPLGPALQLSVPSASQHFVAVRASGLPLACLPASSWYQRHLSTSFCNSAMFRSLRRSWPLGPALQLSVPSTITALGLQLRGRPTRGKPASMTRGQHGLCSHKSPQLSSLSIARFIGQGVNGVGFMFSYRTLYNVGSQGN